ncbi:cysteine--tRNA ligase [Hoeflea alexandrii]|uniref:cysteine--tRNA ligase n=1 Tax=Hoeflea alexandrii TaxID=288436 RepID=UPI0022AF3D61|nr:cysteine--tRNA ligase [Hoeflea alexandrii]MCZ4289067.1 cysteine--tRNA ligase [Hoeflea alexandrii]
MTELKFWNTLTRVKEEFQPIDKDNVRMYVCGPTVYDFAHIGNARPVIVFDVLFRLLRHVYGENHVTYVRNITDVDDKINARALRDYPDLPLNEAIAKVTEKTAERFHKDAAALGCLQPTFEPRATAHIDGMVRMIQTLIDKGNAYVTEGREGREVLFAVSSMPDYGKLSNRKLDEQQAGARIAVEDHKRNPADFVLWKESAADEPGWDGSFSEGGETVTIHGRPGWHIECSVMSEHHLGETFDIHGGGLDLIFPHHENEIAQSCCAHGNDRMANLWMHNGFLQVEGKKMSKSEGNFVTIAELLETEKFGGRKWPGEVLRLAMLMTHYREPIDFSVKRLEEAKSISLGFANLIRQYTIGDGTVLPEVIDALSDDLNTPAAIHSIQRSKADPKDIAESVYFLGLDNSEIARISAELRAQQKAGVRVSVENAFDLVQLSEMGVSKETLEESIQKRLEYLKAKNWPEADRIRDELLEQGIQLKDGKDPQTGERVTTWEVKR